MKRLIASVLITLLIIMTLTSCGSSADFFERIREARNESSAETEPPDPSGEASPATPADPSGTTPVTPTVTPPAEPGAVIPIPDGRELASLWPRIDGSTATIPLTAALVDFIAFALDHQPPEHSTTPYAYYKLINGLADLIFVTYPSENEFKMASDEGIELEIIPVVKDALVFLVNVENPVNNVSLSDLRDIYTGKITSWDAVGGARESIVPYQRNADSGSQTLFLKLLMDGRTPMTPPTEWIPETMGGLVESVSYYDNAKSALGYSVFYFVNDMYKNDQFKLLGIDGVAPTRDSIMSGEYPLDDCYYAVMRKDTPADSPLRSIVDWLLSDAGQDLAVSAGYIPLKPYNSVDTFPYGSAIDPIYLGDVNNSSGTGGTALKSSVDDLDARKPLSDLFFNGFNYIRYINDEIMAYLNKTDNEDFRFTWGDEYLIRPFTGIPNDYPYYDVWNTGYLYIRFPNGNPFFKPSNYSDVSLSIYIRLTEDISPYGTGMPDFSVKYYNSGRFMQNVDLYTVSVNLPASPEVTASINSQLQSWFEALPKSGEAVKLLNDFLVWYAPSPNYPYTLQPTVSRWKNYLSVCYILQTYDGPAFYPPMIFKKCFDTNTGAAIDLLETLQNEYALPDYSEYSRATVVTLVKFNGRDYPSQDYLPEGYIPEPGSFITDVWVMWGSISMFITEPDGRVLQVNFWS